MTPPNTRVEILGVGADFLLGGDLTDPENDGEDAAGAALGGTWNWMDITSSHESDFEGAESAFNIFDNKVGGGNDKWCCDDPTPDAPVWVAVQFASKISLTHFTVASGNDTPDRDPNIWAIQGSNDGDTYVDIFRFDSAEAADRPWTERNQVAKFTLPEPSAPYNYFRYIAYETIDALHQLNEIEYFGVIGGATASDSDGDGMPDDYEKLYGFNPNDASDAAKDFDGDGATNLEEYKAGTNPIDTTKPTLLSVSTSSSFDTVKLTFSEDLDASTATNVANYTFTPSLAITEASYKAKVVTLTTAKQTAGGVAYTVAVAGVKDTSKNAVPDGTQATFFSYILTKTGVLKFSYWGSINNTPVADLYNDPRYPNSPDMVTSVSSFNSRTVFPDDTHDNYGATMEGYLTPTESGDYRFFIYSDDASELYFSYDATETGLGLIAEETGCCNAFTEPDSPRTSEPVSLVAGKKYFIRMVYKEGGGGDYGQVAWRKEGDTTPAGSLTPIPGAYLSAAIDLPFPAEGVTMTQTPAANAKNVLPQSGIKIVHVDGKTAWTEANVSLKLNGKAVTPTFTKVGTEATITLQPDSYLPGGTNRVAFTYPDPAGQAATMEWTFTVIDHAGPVKDLVQGYPAHLMGPTTLTADKGGRTGQAGDRGADFGILGGTSVFIPDATWLNALTARDELSVSIWLKRYDIANSSAFWLVSPSSSSSQRGFQAHTPYSDSIVYFDTSGCCEADVQRITGNMSDFGPYVAVNNVSWWTNSYHHFVFTKKAGLKNVYLDGEWFMSGSGTAVLPSDFTEIYLGSEPGGTAGNMHAIIDDFAVFGAEISQADAVKLYNGTAPTALGATAKLAAYWDFNTIEVGTATLSATRTATGLTLEFTGTLQSADTVNGPFSDVAGAASPYSVTTSTGQKYFRSRN